MEDVHLGSLNCVERLHGVLDVDLRRCHVHHTCVDTADFSVSRLVRNDELLDDMIEGIHILGIRV